MPWQVYRVTSDFCTRLGFIEKIIANFYNNSYLIWMSMTEYATLPSVYQRAEQNTNLVRLKISVVIFFFCLEEKLKSRINTVQLNILNIVFK